MDLRGQTGAVLPLFSGLLIRGGSTPYLAWAGSKATCFDLHHAAVDILRSSVGALGFHLRPGQVGVAICFDLHHASFLYLIWPSFWVENTLFQDGSRGTGPPILKLPPFRKLTNTDPFASLASTPWGSHHPVGDISETEIGALDLSSRKCSGCPPLAEARIKTGFAPREGFRPGMCALPAPGRAHKLHLS